jgi:hypothetical protein
MVMVDFGHFMSCCSLWMPVLHNCVSDRAIDCICSSCVCISSIPPQPPCDLCLYCHD